MREHEKSVPCRSLDSELHIAFSFNFYFQKSTCLGSLRGDTGPARKQTEKTMGSSFTHRTPKEREQHTVHTGSHRRLTLYGMSNRKGYKNRKDPLEERCLARFAKSVYSENERKKG